MTFLWQPMLFSLLLLPVVAALYLLASRRRQAQAGVFARSPSAGPRRPGFRRHVPALLFLLGLAVILVALARPQAEVSLPRIEGTVILVIDVSASMGADDVQPSRLEAAKQAAVEFINSQPETVKIGVVSFSASGFAIQAPTSDTNALLAAVNRLEPTSGTSLGQGIVAALNTIAVDAGLSPPQTLQELAETPAAPQGEDPPRSRDQELLAQLPEGPYPSALIVILSDGEHNQSIDPVQAAAAAAQHEVRIDAIGFGTAAGTVLAVDGFSVHTALNETVLEQITSVAGGSYYAARPGQDLQPVYASLTPQLVVKPEKMEVTAIFAGASIAIFLLGSLFSMLWFNRLP